MVFFNQLTEFLQISVQLWAARELARHLPRAWERYLKQNDDKIVTPSVVQRDFQRIISEIGEPVAVDGFPGISKLANPKGTPARSPKTRGNSIGRVQGQVQTQRTKQPVVKKQSKVTPNKQKAV